MTSKKPRTPTIMPTLAEENSLHTQGYRLIAGIDEVGRGALAGPVVAAAVILPQPADFPWLSEVRDSKEISPIKRACLSKNIKAEATAIGIGIVEHNTIDSIGILKATRVAMQQAIVRLIYTPDFLLIDALRLPQLRIAQKNIIKGDKHCTSIACASIIAKVARDQLMAEFDQAHPGYGFANHKGYGTKQHLSCLQQLGYSPIHRHSFSPVKELRRLI